MSTPPLISRGLSKQIFAQQDEACVARPYTEGLATGTKKVRNLIPFAAHGLKSPHKRLPDEIALDILERAECSPQLLEFLAHEPKLIFASVAKDPILQNKYSQAISKRYSEAASSALGKKITNYEDYLKSLSAQETQVLKEISQDSSSCNDDSPSILRHLRNLPKSFAVALAVVSKDGRAYRNLKNFTDNSGLLMEAVRSDPEAYKSASPKLLKTAGVDLEAAAINGFILKFIPEPNQTRELIFAAVQSRGMAVQFAKAELRAVPEVMLAAIRRQPLAIQFLPPELYHRKDIVITAVSQNKDALQYVPKRYFDDKEVMLAGTGYGFVNRLKFASTRLRKDADVVRKAITESEKAAGYVAASFCDDEIWMKLMMQYRGAQALAYASMRLRNSRLFVRSAVQNNPSCLEWASRELRSDLNFVVEAIRRDPMAIKFAHPDMRKDFRIRHEVSKMWQHDNYHRAVSLLATSPYDLFRDPNVNNHWWTMIQTWDPEMAITRQNNPVTDTLKIFVFEAPLLWLQKALASIPSTAKSFANYFKRISQRLFLDSSGLPGGL